MCSASRVWPIIFFSVRRIKFIIKIKRTCLENYLLLKRLRSIFVTILKKSFLMTSSQVTFYCELLTLLQTCMCKFYIPLRVNTDQNKFNLKVRRAVL